MTDKMIDRIVDASLALASENGWRRITMAEIATSAEVSLSQVYAETQTKTDILVALSRRLDLAVAEAMDGPQEEAARERIFDAVMARFDALSPLKTGAAAVWRDMRRDPKSAALLLAPYLRSVAWTLEAADVSVDGVKGVRRVKTLAWILQRSFLVWLDDDAGQAKTMADLDRRLRRAENVFEGRRLGSRSAGRSYQGGPHDDGEAADARA